LGRWSEVLPLPALRVLVADDQPVVLAGLRVVLGRAAVTKVVGEAATVESAVTTCRALRPDVLLIDIAMEENRGLEGIADLRRVHPTTKTVVFSALGSPDWVREAFRAGASAFISKHQDLKDLAAILAAVHHGQRYLSPTLVDIALSELANPQEDRRAALLTLTVRERQILHLIVKDKSSKEMAAFLGISARTVATHRGNIMRKLDTHTVAGLLCHALKAGILPDSDRAKRPLPGD
jgi:DNA-binding NarL/FixJ family response regulator